MKIRKYIIKSHQHILIHNFDTCKISIQNVVSLELNSETQLNVIDLIIKYITNYFYNC